MILPSESSTTGFGYTNTSHEIEALHMALKQVGSMGSTRDFTMAGSELLATEHTDHTTAAQDTTQGTGATGFGLQPVAQPSEGITL